MMRYQHRVVPMHIACKGKWWDEGRHALHCAGTNVELGLTKPQDQDVDGLCGCQQAAVRAEGQSNG